MRHASPQPKRSRKNNNKENQKLCLRRGGVHSFFFIRLHGHGAAKVRGAICCAVCYNSTMNRFAINSIRVEVIARARDDIFPFS